MLETIAIIILFVGLIGMGFIVFAKIPVLVNLKPKQAEGSVIRRLRSRVGKNGFLKTFSSSEILLQKILSKFRILTLRTESKTGDWLNELRQRTLEKKEKFQDDYWKKLRMKK